MARAYDLHARTCERTSRADLEQAPDGRDQRGARGRRAARWVRRGRQREGHDGIGEHDDHRAGRRDRPDGRREPRPVVVRATNRQTALLTAVRAARHEGYDRIVFQFRNALPGYDVRYVARPVHQDGSGNVVPVQDRYVAQIRMENALDADLTKESAPLTYHGPMRFAGDARGGRAGSQRELRGCADLGCGTARPRRFPREDAERATSCRRRLPQPLSPECGVR